MLERGKRDPLIPLSLRPSLDTRPDYRSGEREREGREEGAEAAQSETNKARDRLLREQGRRSGKLVAPWREREGVRAREVQHRLCSLRLGLLCLSAERLIPTSEKPLAASILVVAGRVCFKGVSSIYDITVDDVRALKIGVVGGRMFIVFRVMRCKNLPVSLQWLFFV